MSRGLPSMTALLGLLALAGYQNRDKLAEMLGNAGGGQGNAGGGQAKPGAGDPLSGMLGNPISAGCWAAPAQAACSAAASASCWINSSRAAKAKRLKSWINHGPNKEVSPPQLKRAIGADVLAQLEQQTGLSQEELLARLSRELPSAVDKYTPEGRLPAA